MRLQIQPEYRLRDVYTALALEEGLYFECLELSFPGAPAEKKEWYRGTGRVSAVHGAFIDVNPASSDPDIAAISAKRIRESCDLAEDLGADHVVFHSACFANLRGAYMDRWAAISGDFFAVTAEDHPSLTILIENAADLDPDPIRALLSRAAHPRVKACLDLGHALCSRTAPEIWMSELSDVLGGLHLSDNSGLFDDHLPLGKGVGNWEAYAARLGKLSEGLPVTLEVGGPDGIRESLRYLAEKRIFGR